MISQISLSRDRRIPLYRQLVEALANAIEQEQIEDGYQLPTIAGLAKSLEVTQSTVIRAYEELAEILRDGNDALIRGRVGALEPASDGFHFCSGVLDGYALGHAGEGEP